MLSRWSRPRFQRYNCWHCPDDEGSMNLWNISLIHWDYMALYLKRLSSLNSLPSGPEIPVNLNTVLMSLLGIICS
jgi:hypothetical protein